MAEDLSKLWQNFSLSGEENLGVEAIDQGMQDVVVRGQSCLVGKLISDRIIGKDALKSTLIRGWRPYGTSTFKVLDDNLFLVEFENVGDKSRVLEGRPWVFEGCLFSVEDFNGEAPPAQMEFDKASFWIRMFNLPLACMTKTMGVQIGNSVGQVEYVETEEHGVGWGAYLRVKIRLNISHPLAMGRFLKFHGANTWVAFQYEKLPKFCYHCGLISHGNGGCLSKKEGPMVGNSSKLQFGPWYKVRETHGNC
jgi:hypothetical protein